MAIEDDGAWFMSAGEGEMTSDRLDALAPGGFVLLLLASDVSILSMAVESVPSMLIELGPLGLDAVLDECGLVIPA